MKRVNNPVSGWESVFELKTRVATQFQNLISQWLKVVNWIKNIGFFVIVELDPRTI